MEKIDNRVMVIMGSTHRTGNTATLTGYFTDELKAQGADVDYLFLGDVRVKPCKGCYHCQNVTDGFGCIQRDDDMYDIAERVQSANMLVLATPIYSWYCTAEMKALTDRLAYGMNKFYGSCGRASLWKGKKVALITTCGYERAYGAGPYETGIKRLCVHSGLEYMGMLNHRDIDGLSDFKTPEAIDKAKHFARFVLGIEKPEHVCAVTRIESERLILRPWTMDDLADFNAMGVQPEVGPDAGWKPHESMDESERILRSFIDEGEVFAVVSKQDGRAIGSLGIHDDGSRSPDRAREIGYVLNRDYWGNGYITEALKRVIRYCFDELHMSILTVNHYVGNERSRRVIEKCGFKYDGRRRSMDNPRLGVVRDGLCYSMTAEEYAASKERSAK